ncbi:MAG: lipopolysaccharide biosynthesis protein RfbH [Victivallaceae bacterium]|nr:lipopolysaccharide biosynthesis protein RfbH [Victivallaceae bacterium]
MDRLESLRREIMEKVAEYSRLAHGGTPFVPGESRLNYAGRVFDEKELCNLTDATLEFWLTSGRFTQEFENRLAAFLGVGHALFVNSGSSANLLAFSALTSPLLGDRRVRRGDEVITVACGFPTTVAPIIQYGAVPVFCDIDAATANIDPESLEAALSSKTRAVMLAHTLGNPFDLAAVKSFCDRHGLWLIEDNCDALGSRYAGRFTGGFGDIGTSSFYPAHHITTGEGGAVYTGDPLLARIMLSLRDWGRDCVCPPGHDDTCGRRFTGQYGTLPVGYDHKYVYSHFGYNLKATDLQAAVGCAQLDKLPDFIARRKHNFARLYEGLNGLPEFEPMRKYPESDPAWFGFLITLTAKGRRGRVVEYLESRRIQTRHLFAGNLTRQPCFEGLVHGVDYRVVGGLENTDRIMNDAFWIGLYPGLSNAEIDYMIETIRRSREL